MGDTDKRENEVKAMRNHFLAVMLLFTSVTAHRVFAKSIKLGLAQTVIENTLNKNRDKLLGFIGRAKTEGCQVVIFPEGALYWPEIAAGDSAKAEIDRAIAQIGKRADSEDVYVVFGVGYKPTDTGSYHNRGVVYDPDGRRLVFYRKNAEVPKRFYVDGVPFNLVICSDRGYLEHSDLPCLVQGSQVIIDISGGHGGDDGRPDLRWIRYKPWALRTNAYVVVCNPVHEDTDFMGHSPWGGGSAVIRPDGSIQASRTYQKDTLIVEEIDTSQATRAGAERRRSHPIFESFWDMGEKLVEGKAISPTTDSRPYSSTERNVKIAAAQMACSRDISENLRKIRSYIRQAAGQGADIVVFPELAVTGHRRDDISAASQPALDSVLHEIRDEADSRNIYVIVGMPYLADGHRRNCAFAIGDDGGIKTRYAQLVPKRSGLFRPGSSTKAMWFGLKGVRAIVTIGDDANWVEIGDLAASRGMYLHFHITYEAYSSADEAILGKQRNLLMLMYAKYGALVNAANASRLPNASASAGGMSMIVSREGGHDRPAPSGLEYYLPYQTSIVKSAGPAETMIVATRKTTARNDLDLTKNWRNRNRKARAQDGWYEWIKKGASLIEKDIY